MFYVINLEKVIFILMFILNCIELSRIRLNPIVNCWVMRFNTKIAIRKVVAA
jgi:hypothetical protein